VLEALACGLAPVLSVIPAFRALAPDPAALFPVGDPDALAAAALRTAPPPPGWFDRLYSFDALAARVEAAWPAPDRGGAARV
jgi:glycosyltransferase involved in cell wall biosynthesis